MRNISSKLALTTVLVASGKATAFVPNSPTTHHGYNDVSTQDVPVSTTTCFAASNGEEIMEPPTFPFSDRQVRFAYDEWRLVYDKGDYNADRFKNFQQNFKTLVVSNLEARAKAAKDGRPSPQWMSLNEYGDYSLDEYQSMMRGEQPVTTNKSITDSPSDTNDTGAVNGAVNGDSTASFENVQVREYLDEFGRSTSRTTIQLNNGEEVVVTNTNNANDIPSVSWGTQVIASDAPVNGSGGGESYGTTVVNGNIVKPTDGTLVIPKSDGTQIIPNGSTDGTQVIPKGFTDGTQVIPKSEMSGTQFIPRNDVGTQVIGKKDDDEDFLSNVLGSIFGSSKKDEDKKEEVVVEQAEKEEKNIVSDFFNFLTPKDDSTASEASAKEEEESKPANGLFSLFGGNVTSSGTRPVRTSISLQKKSRTIPGFRSRRKTKFIPETKEDENNLPSILSFFGGAKKVDERSDSRPTLIVKKPKSIQDQLTSLFSTEKSTVAINSDTYNTNPVRKQSFCDFIINCL